MNRLIKNFLLALVLWFSASPAFAILKSGDMWNPVTDINWDDVECGRARSCSPAGVNPVPEGRPTTG